MEWQRQQQNNMLPIPQTPARWVSHTRDDTRTCLCTLRRVPRSDALLRRTGRHPFNAEPSPKELLAAGFLTPTPMHFVRNHGAGVCAGGGGAGGASQPVTST